MRKPIIASQLIQAFCIVFSAFFIISCSKKDSNPTPADEKCGDSRNWRADLNMDDIQNYSVTGGVANFSFEDLNTPTNICPDEHVTINYEVQLVDSIAGAKWYGKSYWQGLQGSQIPLNLRNGGTYAAESDIVGLKMAYQDNPAWIGVRIFVTFPSQGTEQQDRNYLAAKLTKCGIDLNYKVVK